jgi:hypothetical protein
LLVAVAVVVAKHPTVVAVAAVVEVQVVYEQEPLIFLLELSTT